MQNLLRGIFCCVLVALVVSGLWAAIASNQTSSEQVTKVETPDSNPTSVGIDQVVNLSLAELSRQSDLIAIGKCIGTKSAWIDRSLVTLATIEVGEVLKGEQQSTVTVVLPGGVDVNRKIPVAMRFAGAPRIMSGEEVFLFLTDADANGLTVTGYSQGKFSVVADAQGRKVVSRDQTQVKLPGGPGAVQGTVLLTPLADFKAEVQSYQQ